MPLKHSEKGYIDQVVLTSNEEMCRLVKVKMRTIKIPQIGDKFASRHGQKGTCGMTYRQEDLPFTVEGVVPDMIVNPHAIPSRMTIGHMIEAILSKVASLNGNEGDATPFQGQTVDYISNQLHSLGYQRYGNEDCMISHGAARFLKERLFDVSDCYRVHVCNKCGLFCEANLLEFKYHCRRCDSAENICQVKIPYACKLLL